MLATVDQLAAYLGVTVDGDDQGRAWLAVAYASARVRSWCGWTITTETVTDQYVDGSGRRDIWLPTLRLTAVTSVTDTTTSTVLTYDTDYTWTSDGRLHRPTGWAYVPRLLQVTYTHGYDTCPDDVSGAVLALAARRFDNPQQHRQERIDDYSVTAAAGPAHGLSDAEQAALGPYRIVPL